MQRIHRAATTDLTSAPILSSLLRFCLPILLGNIMQQLYNMADAAIVGKVIGNSALAAVGATGSITFLVIGFVEGICAGFCIPVAQAFGANDESELRRCTANIVWLGCGAAILVTAVVSVLLGNILTAMEFRRISDRIPISIFVSSLRGSPRRSRTTRRQASCARWETAAPRFLS